MYVLQFPSRKHDNKVDRFFYASEQYKRKFSILYFFGCTCKVATTTMCKTFRYQWMIFAVAYIVHAIHAIAWETWKKIRASTGFQPVTSRYRCVLTPTNWSSYKATDVGSWSIMYDLYGSCSVAKTNTFQIWSMQEELAGEKDNQKHKNIYNEL